MPEPIDLTAIRGHHDTYTVVWAKAASTRGANGATFAALAAARCADDVPGLLAEVTRLTAALHVCGFVLHRAEPTDAQVHAGQHASGAPYTDWTPERVEEDFPVGSARPLDARSAARRCPVAEPTMPKAWTDLLEALALLATHQSNDISPLHCEHDQLTVMADPSAFNPEELARLDELGFHPGDDGTFYSFRYGSA